MAEQNERAEQNRLYRSRIAAYGIDVGLAMLVVCVVFVASVIPLDAIRDRETQSRARELAASAAFALYFAMQWGRDALFGRSVGRRILGIRLIDRGSQKRPAFGRMLLREALTSIDSLFFLGVRRRLADAFLNLDVVFDEGADPRRLRRLTGRALRGAGALALLLAALALAAYATVGLPHIWAAEDNDVVVNGYDFYEEYTPGWAGSSVPFPRMNRDNGGRSKLGGSASLYYRYHALDASTFGHCVVEKSDAALQRYSSYNTVAAVSQLVGSDVRFVALPAAFQQARQDGLVDATWQGTREHFASGVEADSFEPLGSLDPHQPGTLSGVFLSFRSDSCVWRCVLLNRKFFLGHAARKIAQMPDAVSKRFGSDPRAVE